MNQAGTLIVTTPSDREIAMTRVLEAPRRVVFDAFEMTPENEALLRETVQRCEKTVLARRAHYAQRVLQFQRFQSQLAELL